ncbi:unnamed protein product [Polarella glacialis]|uniref:Gfo/Idh/MocA-like oxidoreductase N-terminal domain-containing protein n=1 Tax=Polarella glacialis TaxID=89957 RepID=A0A813J5V4_POLGL|nr:unnamed protein product [Polarella glacialis]
MDALPAEEGRQKARIAVAGAGWWSQGWHLPQLHRNPDAEITAIVEPCLAPRSTLNPDMKTTEELAKLYGVPVFSSIDDFLASPAAKVTDGVIVASNHASHHEIGTKSMQAGLHVLIEKPMSTDPREAHELACLAAESNKLFMVNNSANFREQAKKAHELVRAGELGEIRQVQCYMGSALLWLFDNPENVGWVKPSGTMQGNGFGWGQLSHSLAWVYMVTGLTPEGLTCHMGYSAVTGADIFDSAVVRCTNGATISVQGVAALPFKSYTESTKQIDNKIFGTEGMLTYSGEDMHPDSGALILKRHDGKDQRFEGFYFENYSADGYGPESLKAFIDSCLGKPVFNGADAIVGLKAVQTIDAMYRSAKSGQPESVV